MVYLGGVLCGDGYIGAEFGKIIGGAQADLRLLSKFWSHACMSRVRKVQIFHACDVSKLMYSLSLIHI